MRYRDLLKNRNFLLYNLGQMLSQFADRLVHLGLIGIIYRISPGSTIQLAKILFFTVFPAFIISPIAGVYVDRLNKKNILVASNIIRSLTVFAIPLFFLEGHSLIPIYIMVFIIFASACFFLPAKLSMMPDFVDDKNLLIANSLSTSSWIIAGIIGFSIGAFIVEFLGIKFSLFINASLYLMSATVLSLVSIHKKAALNKLSLKDVTKDFEDALRKSFFYELKEGITYLLSHKQARFVVGTFFVFMSVIGSLYVVMVVFIQDMTHSMTKGLGVFGIFLFLGFLIGSFFYGKFGHKISKTKIISVSFILSGLFVSVFAVMLKMFFSFLLGNLFMFLIGLSISAIATSGNTIIHETIDKNMRGRIFSSMGIIMNGGFMVFMFLSSILAEHIDRLWVILAGGFVFLIVGAVNYILDRGKGPISPSP